MPERVARRSCPPPWRGPTSIPTFGGVAAREDEGSLETPMPRRQGRPRALDVRLLVPATSRDAPARRRAASGASPRDASPQIVVRAEGEVAAVPATGGRAEKVRIFGALARRVDEKQRAQGIGAFHVKLSLHGVYLARFQRVFHADQNAAQHVAAPALQRLTLRSLRPEVVLRARSPPGPAPAAGSLDPREASRRSSRPRTQRAFCRSPSGAGRAHHANRTARSERPQCV